MKYYIRTYRVQITLIVMGALMCMAASSIYTDYNRAELFLMGAGLLVLGIVGWAAVQLASYAGSRSGPQPAAAVQERRLRSPQPPARRQH